MPDRDDNPAASLTSPGLGLGERLRSARKARALSVQQVADSLRLEEASVIALEDGRFEAMGAAVFVRGHLRRYAQLVGLSPEAVLEAYRVAAPESVAPPSIARPREQSDAVRVPAWVYWVGAALILAGLAFALRDGGGDKVSAPAAVPAAITDELPVNVPSPPAPPPENEVASPAAPMPADVPPAESAPTVTEPATPQPGAGE